MRFHVVANPHAPNISVAPYTRKVALFCRMMQSLGHVVYLYAPEGFEAPCYELIPCVTADEQAQWFPVKPDSEYSATFDAAHPAWRLMNDRAITRIKERAEPQDFICVVAGYCQKEIADAFPAMMTVEFGVGYPGIFAKYKVFESYAWMHYCYGRNGIDDGTFLDTVIPNYFDPDDFTMSEEREPYYLYLGRVTPRKGVMAAAEACRVAGAKLLIAGQGSMPELTGDHITHMGAVGDAERLLLLSRATAVFMPTQYLEPFGSVQAESGMCGVPVIATDWGSFTETIVNGVNGYRTRTLGEMVLAMDAVKILDREAIRAAAIHRFGIDHVRWQYDSYFQQLSALWTDGWYTMEHQRLSGNAHRNVVDML